MTEQYVQSTDSNYINILFNSDLQTQHLHARLNGWDRDKPATHGICTTDIVNENGVKIGYRQELFEYHNGKSVLLKTKEVLL